MNCLSVKHLDPSGTKNNIWDGEALYGSQTNTSEYCWFPPETVQRGFSPHRTCHFTLNILQGFLYRHCKCFYDPHRFWGRMDFASFERVQPGICLFLTCGHVRCSSWIIRSAAWLRHYTHNCHWFLGLLITFVKEACNPAHSYSHCNNSHWNEWDLSATNCQLNGLQPKWRL